MQPFNFHNDRKNEIIRLFAFQCKLLKKMKVYAILELQGGAWFDRIQ